jgi:hypothetical protein
VTNLEDLDCDALRQVVRRDRYVMDALSQRLSAMTLENATLLAILQEHQDAADAQQGPPPAPVPPEFPHDHDHPHGPEPLNSVLHN